MSHIVKKAIIITFALLAGFGGTAFWTLADCAEPVQPSITLGAPKTSAPPREALGLDQKGQPVWITLEDGLEFGEFKLSDEDSKITILRIDPEKFDFMLGASSLDGNGPRTLEQWAKEYDLVAAINASMYLPDNRTSTGYMRSGEHVNQNRVMERFGAFFVAGPRKDGIPRAMILDKDQPDWKKRLEDYDIVIQNYRMTNDARRILWSPGGPLYSISALAQDGDGRIMFLHSRVPVEAYGFVQHLLHLPLNIRTIMYVEGGAQAGLIVNSSPIQRQLAAPHAPSFLVTGILKAQLPNIIGLKQNHKSLN